MTSFCQNAAFNKRKAAVFWGCVCMWGWEGGVILGRKQAYLMSVYGGNGCWKNNKGLSGLLVKRLVLNQDVSSVSSEKIAGIPKCLCLLHTVHARKQCLHTRMHTHTHAHTHTHTHTHAHVRTDTHTHTHTRTYTHSLKDTSSLKQP